MRTLRLSLVGTVVLTLLGAMGGAVLAQMDADADAVYVVRVSEEAASSDVGSWTETETLYSSRDGWITATHDWSDPRVSGAVTTTFHVDVDPATGQGLIWGTTHIENDGGTWNGSFRGVEYETLEGDFHTENGWLAGDGDYAGYTFYYQVDGQQRGGPTRVAHGVIFKGEAPPAIEAITDPIKVVAAKQDAVAGYLVVPTLRVVSAAEVSSDVFTDLREVKGRKAAVDIPAGRPITPELLEPAD